MRGELLSKEQSQRYARQLALPEIGAAGQKRLLAGRVLLVGARLYGAQPGCSD